MPTLYNRVRHQFDKRTKQFYVNQRGGISDNYISLLEFYVINYNVEIIDKIEHMLQAYQKEHIQLFRSLANREVKDSDTERNHNELYNLVQYYPTELSAAIAHAETETRF